MAGYPAILDIRPNPTHYHAQLGLPDKGCAIKELDVGRLIKHIITTLDLRYTKITPSAVSNACRLSVSMYSFIYLFYFPHNYS